MSVQTHAVAVFPLFVVRAIEKMGRTRCQIRRVEKCRVKGDTQPWVSDPGRQI